MIGDGKRETGDGDGSAGSSQASSQELLPKYTEQERQLTCPEGACVQAVFQQPELRGMSARARPRVTLRMVFVLFAELLFFALDLNNFLRPPLLKVQLAHPPTTSSAFPNAGESIRTLNFVV